MTYTYHSVTPENYEILKRMGYRARMNGAECPLKNNELSAAQRKVWQIGWDIANGQLSNQQPVDDDQR